MKARVPFFFFFISDITSLTKLTHNSVKSYRLHLTTLATRKDHSSQLTCIALERNSLLPPSFMIANYCQLSCVHIQYEFYFFLYNTLFNEQFFFFIVKRGEKFQYPKVCVYTDGWNLSV